MSQKIKILAGVIAACLANSPVQAVQFDGFITVGGAVHDDKNKNRYIGSLGDRGITDKFSFETDTRFGLQISSEVAKDMSVVSQILGTGVDGNFNAVVEWAYVDYEVNENISIRAGKIKQPVYLVNDYVEVGYAYPWIRPPVEVYYLNNPLNTVNGVEILFQYDVGPGTLSLQPYFGSNRDDIPNTSGQGFFEAESITGIDIKYSGRGYTAHFSNFTCDVKLNGQLQSVPTVFGFPVNIDLSGTGECEVSSVGLNLDINNIVVYSEWQKRTTTDTLARPFGQQDAFYATFGYRFGKYLPHITFASIDGTSGKAGPFAVTCDADPTAALGSEQSNCAGATGSASANSAAQVTNFPVAVQTSVTAGLRYELNDSAALKFEYSVVDVDTVPQGSPGNPFGINFGLFDTSFTGQAPTEKVGITSIALDVIF